MAPASSNGGRWSGGRSWRRSGKWVHCEVCSKGGGLSWIWESNIGKDHFGDACKECGTAWRSREAGERVRGEKAQAKKLLQQVAKDLPEHKTFLQTIMGDLEKVEKTKEAVADRKEEVTDADILELVEKRDFKGVEALQKKREEQKKNKELNVDIGKLKKQAEATHRELQQAAQREANLESQLEQQKAKVKLLAEKWAKATKEYQDGISKEAERTKTKNDEKGSQREPTDYEKIVKERCQQQEFEEFIKIEEAIQKGLAAKQKFIKDRNLDDKPIAKSDTDEKMDGKEQEAEAKGAEQATVEMEEPDAIMENAPEEGEAEANRRRRRAEDIMQEAMAEAQSEQKQKDDDAKRAKKNAETVVDNARDQSKAADAAEAKDPKQTS